MNKVCVIVNKRDLTTPGENGQAKNYHKNKIEESQDENKLNVLKAPDDEDTNEGSDGDVSPNTMRLALAAIAQELARFRPSNASTPLQSESGEHDKTSKELQICKSKLRIKKSQIKKLKKNLKIACAIAKTAMASKDTLALNSNLNFSQVESENISKRNEENYTVVKKLTEEKEILCEKIQNVYNFIELGYQELRKMRNEKLSETEDLTVVMKLKQIMISCGQYYADYCNEHEKCMQLESRNRFLTNKLSILENNLETASEELKELKFNLLKGRKIKNQTLNIHKIGFVTAENQYSSKKVTNELTAETNPTSQNLDLSTHFSLVKNLLTDQDSMLKDLRKLQQELHIFDKS